MDRSFPAICLVCVMLLSLGLLTAWPVVPSARAQVDRDAVLDLTFPVGGAVTYTDTYDADRDGGSRRHQGTDVFGDKGQPLHAVVSGRICFAPGIGEPMPGYGYMLRICADGVTYSYLHLNNDTPGTDDGQADHTGAYAPGIRDGVQVQRGQLIGWMGDSGNAEDTPPHLHLDIYDRAFTDPDLAEAPWRQHYRNPYPSLRAAQERGDLPGGSALRVGARGLAVATWQDRLNAASDAGLEVDGVFGPATDTATRTFQQAQGLEVDGIVGPATLGAMDRLDGGSVEDPILGVVSTSAGPARLLRLTEPLMRGDDVQAWQDRMRERGWRGADGAPLAVDGIFGSDSQRAARLFQEEMDLTVDGIVGPETWEAAFAPAA